MGISVIIESVKVIGQDPYKREVTTLLSLWRNYGCSLDTILEWFADRLDIEHIALGPYYEFKPGVMDDLVEACEKALNNEGPFAGKEGMPEQDCRNIIETVTKFKKENEDDWEQMYFQVSAS